MCATFHYVRHDAAWVLGARNKFKLRSLTVDCRAEDADADAAAAAVTAAAAPAAGSRLKRRPSHGPVSIEAEKCIYM